MEIFELAKELKDTPLPIILAFAGLLFVYLYINDKFAKKLGVSSVKQKYSLRYKEPSMSQYYMVAKFKGTLVGNILKFEEIDFIEN